VQAGVARLVVADDPERAQEAIGAVEDAGLRALDELRHLLGVLRPETASGELGPQPALSQVPRLVDRLSPGSKFAPHLHGLWTRQALLTESSPAQP
jgi:signal transduction histidine kinase